ncbi:MAG TPA: GFA family protein [Caulobacteraceae bacterium]|nr:GFA family protein [Caulobacteraceae bacterium]
MISGSCHCGGVRWTFDAEPEGATACNCTICRRYGTLWIYDYEGGVIATSGETRFYERGEWNEFHFCPTCACVTWWRAKKLQPDGRRRMGINLRLADDPDAIAHIPIDHFDGLTTMEDLPRDGKCVADMWF